MNLDVGEVGTAETGVAGDRWAVTVVGESYTVTGLLVTAVEAVWTQIRRRHPAVPDVVVTLGCGSSRPGSVTLGAFAPNRWVQGEVDVHELFIGGEGLADGPVELLGTLLHEAAHGMAATRGVKDTSRQGRWHNDRFRELAAELGLDITKDDRIGWSLTTIPAATRDRYRREIEQLGHALVAHRRREPHAARGGGKPSNNGVAAECGCGRRIRVAKTVYQVAPIVCGACGQPSQSTISDPTTNPKPQRPCQFSAWYERCRTPRLGVTDR